jgi:hypothetical protein
VGYPKKLDVTRLLCYAEELYRHVDAISTNGAIGRGSKNRRYQPEGKLAQIHLKADLNRLGWTDKQFAEAFDCRVQRVAEVHRRVVERCLGETLNGAKKADWISHKSLDGKPEAQLIAMRLGVPHNGYTNLTLRLLAREVVELGVVRRISHENVRGTQKKG